MYTLRITDRNSKASQKEKFLNNKIQVVSRSGLHATETLLIENLTRLSTQPASILIAGNRTGVITMTARHLFPESALTCHAFDLHHVRAIGRNLMANDHTWRFQHDPFVTAIPGFSTSSNANDRHAVTLACTTSVPSGPYDVALFMASKGSMSGELILDQLEQIHASLATDGVCLLACETDRTALHKQVKALFGNATVLFDRRGVICLLVRKREPLTQLRNFCAHFPASVPNGPQLTLCSLPGVFCHRRPDWGGLALAEIAVTELTPNARVLDMGCGCGLVGLLLATSRSDARVTFLDSHARALAATHANLATLGLENHPLVLSDEGLTTGKFSLFVGNPPYYSDFRIAELFLKSARATLQKGGCCLMVAKNAQNLAARQADCFGTVDVLPRRGYGVVKSRC